MIRRVIAFDLDNTLAESKSPITGEMAGLLDRLLARSRYACGGRKSRFGTEIRVSAPYRSRINSVLKLSTKLSAVALSNASPTEPIEASTPWSSRVWV